MFLHIVKLVLSFLVAYLVGSFPTAFVLAKLYKRIDIRQHGSGNVGATNAFRILGKLPGIIVLIIDIGKGLLCPTLVADLFGQTALINRIVLGITVVAGHNWTVFLRFKGGKGMATGLGVLIGLAIKAPVVQPVLLLSVLAWIISFFLSGIVSLSSIIAVFFLPVLMVVFSVPIELIVLGIIFCVFVVLRHRSNISRLIKREEPRVFKPFLKRR
jgi:acyl phosphate:glycerol-3-phosphate acyltransferase